jgi:hypothetical protein
MAIEHDFFGLLESGPDGSLFWSENVELGDQQVTIDLTAPDENDVTSASLDVAAAMVSSLEEIDRRAREAMLAQVDDRTSEVTEYILQQQAHWGDELESLLVDVSGDAAVDIIRSLDLVSVTILADELGTGEPFAVLEYALDSDDAEDVLLVNLDSGATVSSARARLRDASSCSAPDRRRADGGRPLHPRACPRRAGGRRFRVRRRGIPVGERSG